MNFTGERYTVPSRGCSNIGRLTPHGAIRLRILARNSGNTRISSSGVLPPRPASQEMRSAGLGGNRSEEHTSELQSRLHLVCRLLLEKKKKNRGQRRMRLHEPQHYHGLT